MQTWLRCWPVVLCVLLAACNNLNQAAINGLKAAYEGPNRNFESVPRNPALIYMQVEVPGAASLTVLGYQYPNNVQVWYSGKGEVVRLQGNRLLDTSGLNVNLANVQYTPSAQAQLTRMQFDVPELGLFNASATLQLQPTQPPTSDLAKQASTANGLFWYTESTVGQLPAALTGLPPAVYGFAQALPEGTPASQLPLAVYGKQCLAPTYCLEWHRQ